MSEITIVDEDKSNNIFERVVTLKDANIATSNEPCVNSDPSIVFLKLSELKGKLYDLRFRLNKLDLKKWSLHCKYMNGFYKIPKNARFHLNAELTTRAWPKFIEILHRYWPKIDSFRVQPHGSEHGPCKCCLSSFHLCEGPGSFITGLNHFLASKREKPEVNWRWMANTLNPYFEGQKLDEMIQCDTLIIESLENWEFGADGTGDITEHHNARSLAKTIEQNMGPIHLVTADGSLDCSDSLHNQEDVTRPLIFWEALIALSVIMEHGTMILKTFSFFQPSTIALIYFIQKNFRFVEIFKPATSEPSSSEVYLICIDCCTPFNSRTKFCFPAMERLAQSHGKMMEASDDDFSLWGQILDINTDSIPSDFFDKILLASEYFTNIQIKATEKCLANFKPDYEFTSEDHTKFDKSAEKFSQQFFRRFPLEELCESNSLLSQDDDHPGKTPKNGNCNILHNQNQQIADASVQEVFKNASLKQRLEAADLADHLEFHTWFTTAQHSSFSEHELETLLNPWPLYNELNSENPSQGFIKSGAWALAFSKPLTKITSSPLCEDQVNRLLHFSRKKKWGNQYSSAPVIKTTYEGLDLVPYADACCCFCRRTRGLQIDLVQEQFFRDFTSSFREMVCCYRAVSGCLRESINQSSRLASRSGLFSSPSPNSGISESPVESTSKTALKTRIFVMDDTEMIDCESLQPFMNRFWSKSQLKMTKGRICESYQSQINGVPPLSDMESDECLKMIFIFTTRPCAREYAIFEMDHQLDLLKSLYVALSTLQPGSGLLIQLGECLTLFTLNLLSIICSCFGLVLLSKTTSFICCPSHNWLWADRFKQCPQSTLEFIKTAITDLESKQAKVNIPVSNHGTETSATKPNPVLKLVSTFRIHHLLSPSHILKSKLSNTIRNMTNSTGDFISTLTCCSEMYCPHQPPKTDT